MWAKEEAERRCQRTEKVRVVAEKIKKRLEESKEDTKKRADKLADFARPKKDTKPPPLSEESAAAAEGPEAVHWAVNKESGQAKGIEGKALRIRLRRSRSRLYRRRLFQVVIYLTHK